MESSAYNWHLFSFICGKFTSSIFCQALVTALKLNTTIEVITCELCLMADSKDLGYKKYNGDKPA